MQINRYWKAIAGGVAGALIPLVNHFFGIAVPEDAVPPSLTDQAVQSAVGALIGALLPYIAPKNAD